MAILVHNKQTNVPVDEKRLEDVLSAILTRLACHDKEVSLVIVDDEEIRGINKEYLGRDYTTNVISFAMTEGSFGDVNPYLLGDIVISADTTRRDAEAGGVSFDDMMDFLIIHGMLHLVGYDHEQADSDAALMKEKEDELFFFLKGYHLEYEL